MNSSKHFLNLSSKSLINTLLFALILTAFPFISNAQWNYLNSPTTSEAYMEVVNNDTIVYSLDATGDIYHSYDGGETWSAFQTGLEYSWIYDFDFPTNQIGYGCGGTFFGLYQDVIIKTEDAGLTWDTLTTNSFGQYTFNNIGFLNPDTGFVASSYLLLRTQDGGESFTPLQIGSDEVFTIRSLQFNSYGALFVSASTKLAENSYRISIYRSGDLGETWQEVYVDEMDDVDFFNNRFVGEIVFPDQQTGYACGGNGLFLKTIDAGFTWTQSFISPLSNLTAIDFTSTEVGYINNAGGISKTTDGGITWTAQNMNVPAIVQDIQFASANVGYALTDAKLYKTVNAGEIMNVLENEIAAKIKVFPNPAREFVSIDFPKGRIQSVVIYDVVGRNVISLSANFEKINLAKLPPGIYILNILTDKGLVTKRLIKN